MSLRRRTLLRVGAGALAAVGLAGCGTDGGTTSDGEALAIETVSFCRSEPRGFDDCDVQPEAPHAPGDSVWHYLEPAGVALAGGDAEDQRIAVSQAIEVADPHGEVVLTNEGSVEREVPTRDAVSQLFLTANLTVPPAAHAGEYTVTTTLTDEVAGDTVTETATFSVAGQGTVDHVATPFELTAVTFCEDRPEPDGTCQVAPEATFEPGATVWHVVDTSGVHFQRTGTDLEIRVEAAVTVTGPGDDVVFEDALETGVAVSSEEDVSSFFFAYPLATQPGTASGEYETTIELTDVYGSTAPLSAAFRLR